MREVGDLLGLMFYEMQSPRAQFAEGFVEPAFNSRNFRPAKRTSIEAFTKLLVPEPVGAA
jgi:hypothetical protein